MTKNILVHKFGGEIAGTPEYLRKSAEIIRDKSEYTNITVISALRGITESLAEKCDYFSKGGSESEIDSYIQKLRQIHYSKINNLKEQAVIEENLERELEQLKGYLTSIYDFESINPRMEDKVLVYGEGLSSEIFRGYFSEKEVESKILTGRDIGIITNDNHGDADIDWELTEGNIANYLEPLLEEEITPIISGFDGKTPEGEITTLGRGGSDTTACVVGLDLKAREINLYKTTRGVTTADPKIVGEKVKTIPFLNYYEAMEAGKIIHRKGVKHARKGEIPIIVRYISDPEIKTVINGNKNAEKGVKLITCEQGCYIIEIYDPEMAEKKGQLGYLSDLMANNDINLEIARDGFNSLTFVPDSNTTKESIEAVEKTLKAEYDSVTVISGVSILRAIGNLGYDSHKSYIFNEIIEKNTNPEETCLGSYPYGYTWGLDGIVPDPKSKDIVRKLHKKLIE